MGAWHGLTSNFLMYGLYLGTLLFAQGDAHPRRVLAATRQQTTDCSRGALHVANSLFVFVVLAMGMNIII